MNMKFVILLAMALSLALSGCAKKGPAGSDAGNVSAGTGGNAPDNGAGAGAESSGNTTSGSQGGAGESGDKNGNLSDLFIIDTDKPLGDEGLGTGTPGADK